ncbi:hypothetical protein D3C78_1874080 [compost metagenome]
MRRREIEPLVVGEGLGDRVGPVLQVLQVAVLVEGDGLSVDQKGVHSQALTLSKRVQSSTNPG